MEFKIREMKETEYYLLNDFLYEAIFVPKGVEPPPKSIVNSTSWSDYCRNLRGLIENTDNLHTTELGIDSGIRREKT